MKQIKSLYNLPHLLQMDDHPSSQDIFDQVKNIQDRLHDLSFISNRDEQMSTLDELLDLLATQEKLSIISPKDQSTCFEMADTILNILGGYSKRGSLGQKYSRLYNIKSQIENNDGRFWSSYWTSLLSQYSFQEVAAGESFLVLGVRNLRLFQGCLALNYFEKAMNIGIPKILEDYCTIQTIRASFLSNDLGQAKTCIENWPFENKWKLEWYQATIQAIETLDLTAMERITRKGGQAYSGENIMLFYGWSLSVKTRRWSKDLVPLASLKRRKGLELTSSDGFYKMILVLMECYDGERPFIKRLEALGDMLSSVHMLETEEQELLVWAAATRWLWRGRAREFARACKDQYERRSWTLSNGRTKDVFNVLTDIEIDEI